MQVVESEAMMLLSSCCMSVCLPARNGAEPNRRKCRVWNSPRFTNTSVLR